LNPPAETVNHHLTGAGEFSTGRMGIFQPVLTAVENTFVQFYPTLLDIATHKGTLNHAYSEKGSTQ
jgi:hypothetical protein